MLTKCFSVDYIRGFADGEGGFHGHAIHMANTELPLIQGIAKTLSEVGIKCAIQRQKTYGRRKQIYRLVITDTLNIARYAYHIGFCQQSKQEAVEHYIQHICRKGRRYNLEDYYQYVELSGQGASIRKMSRVLGIYYNTMWTRITRNIYPLSDKDIEVLKPFQPPN